MEHLAICVCEGLEKRLEKLAHGIYFNEDDPDVISTSEKIKKSLSSIGHESKPGRSFEDFLKMLDSRIRKGVDATGDDVFDDSFDDADDDIDAEFNDACDELGDDADAFSDISFAALFPEEELA